MWINYFLTYAARKYFIEAGDVNFASVSVWEDGYIPPNECSMMIPGTYAEMHKDYD